MKSIKAIDSSQTLLTPRQAVQLLKPYEFMAQNKKDPLQPEEPEDEEEEEEDESVAPVFAERGFSWHALRLVLQAGEAEPLQRGSQSQRFTSSAMAGKISG